jgi:hypothetical protein
LLAEPSPLTAKARAQLDAIEAAAKEQGITLPPEPATAAPSRAGAD